MAIQQFTTKFKLCIFYGHLVFIILKNHVHIMIIKIKIISLQTITGLFKSLLKV